jgi:thymidylate synthase (FAD)
MSEVNLVGITQPNEEYTGCKTANELIAWVARVSNPSNQNNTETAPRLIRYLIKHRHWSPFEMVHLSLEIKTTRDIARQILRHRSFSFQEYSQRYADPTQDLGFVKREARLQDTKNRQNSIVVDDPELSANWESSQREVAMTALQEYNWALSKGIAKEQARALLPEGLTESVVIMSGSLRSWVHYCELRMGVETQKEHRIVAEQCWQIISAEFPDVQQAYENIKSIEMLRSGI